MKSSGTTKNLRNIDNNVVFWEFSVKKDKNAPQAFKIGLEVDFSDVPHATLLAWATAHLTINLQDRLRRCDEEFLQQLTKTGIKRHAFDVGAGFGDEASTFEKSKQAVARLTPAQRAELLAMLQAEG